MVTGFFEIDDYRTDSEIIEEIIQKYNYPTGNLLDDLKIKKIIEIELCKNINS